MLKICFFYNISQQIGRLEVFYSKKELNMGQTEPHKQFCEVNKSFKDFGFLDLPTYVTVRPNSGFGIILPNEELNLEVLFSVRV